jgi:T4 bacteriophage base plate protein
MSLPKIKHPTFNDTLPVSKIKYTFRPFLVKEEKVLLMAFQSGDPKDISHAIIQIATNCIVSSEKPIDFPKLSVADAMYVFVKLRACSVDNMMEVKFEGRTIEVDLHKITAERASEHDGIISLDSDLKMKLRMPTIEMVEEFGEEVSDKQSRQLLIDCIESIYSNSDDNVFTPKDASAEEMSRSTTSSPRYPS